MKITNIEIKTLEPIQTISVHYTGPYAGISASFQKLGQWAGQNEYWAKEPRMIGIYHDDPSQVAPDKLRSSACLEDKGGMEPASGMERYRVSGGKYMVMTAHVTMPEYREAWIKAYEAVAESGLERDMRDHYELYLGCVDESLGNDSPWAVEFRIPVK